jgi:hypothetical protein
MKSLAIGLVAGSLGLFLGVGTATAATTSISTSSEPALVGAGGILDQLYGSENLLRIDDNFDQVWFPAVGSATAVAKFASYSQQVGYIPDLNGDNVFDESFVALFDVSGSTDGIDLGGPSANLNSGNVNFAWALDPSGAPLWTSLPSENSDSLDHMVTWQITGGEGNTVGNYVIAWEDLPGGGDRDYNDLVLEVSVQPVPIPAAVWLFVSGLLGLSGIARARRKGD